MKDELAKRIADVRSAEDSEKLKKGLCPFFESGKHPTCLGCLKDDKILDECKEYFLTNAINFDSDVWNDTFGSVVVKGRETKASSEIIGIGVNCNYCYMSEKCPMFKEGYTCAIDWGDNKPKNSKDFMDWLIDVQYQRVKRASVFEKIDGGVPDANLSAEMDRLRDMLQSKETMGMDRLSINVEASAQPGGGILAKLFGGKPALENNPPETIDITEIPEKEKIPIENEQSKG